MISAKDIKKLADLARIEVSERETETLAKDIEEIVGYVKQVQEISAGKEKPAGFVAEPHNVFREDTKPHSAGEYTDALVSAAKETKDGFIRVKKIL
jgi:aspartyl-tRNA(Asn)/glutamyl-tRNA(Gln) amidotransferase subunit C